MLDVAALGLAPGDVRRSRRPDRDWTRSSSAARRTRSMPPDGGTVELQATSGGLYMRLRFAAT